MSMETLRSYEIVGGALGALTDAQTAYGATYELFWTNWIECGITIPAATGGATTPTLDVTFETSLDGVNWTTLFTFTQIAALASTQRKANHRYQATPILIGSFGRFKYVIADGGGAPVYTGTAYVLAGG